MDIPMNPNIKQPMTFILLCLMIVALFLGIRLILMIAPTLLVVSIIGAGIWMLWKIAGDIIRS